MSSTLKALLIAGTLAFTVASAHAEFSPREKQQILRQVDAMNTLSAAAGEVVSYLQSHPGPYNQVQVQNAVYALSGPTSPRSKILSGLVWLSGANGTSLGSHNAAAASNRHDNAFGAFDEAVNAYRTAETRLDALRRSCDTGCAHIDSAAALLRRSRELSEGFERGLSYSNPWRASETNVRSEYTAALESLQWTNDKTASAWHESNGLASVPELAALAIAASADYQSILWRVGWAFGLVVGAEHPSLTQEVNTAAGEVGSGNRAHAQFVIAQRLLSDFTVPSQGQANGLPAYYAGVCADKAALLSSKRFSQATRAIGREIRHLCEASWGASGAQWQAALHSYSELGEAASGGSANDTTSPEE